MYTKISIVCALNLVSCISLPVLKIKTSPPCLLSIRWVDGLHGPRLLFAGIMSCHRSVYGLSWSTGHHPRNPDLFQSKHPAVLLPACPLPGGPGQHPRRPWHQPLRWHVSVPEVTFTISHSVLQLKFSFPYLSQISIHCSGNI